MGADPDRHAVRIGPAGWSYEDWKGIVYPAERAPYVVVILTEWQPDRSGRQSAIASLSRVVYQHVTAGDVHAR